MKSEKISLISSFGMSNEDRIRGFAPQLTRAEPFIVKAEAPVPPSGLVQQVTTRQNSLRSKPQDCKLMASQSQCGQHIQLKPKLCKKSNRRRQLKKSKLPKVVRDKPSANMPHDKVRQLSKRSSACNKDEQFLQLTTLGTVVACSTVGELCESQISLQALQKVHNSENF